MVPIAIKIMIEESNYYPYISVRNVPILAANRQLEVDVASLEYVC